MGFAGEILGGDDGPALLVAEAAEPGQAQGLLLPA